MQTERDFCRVLSVCISFCILVALIVRTLLQGDEGSRNKRQRRDEEELLGCFCLTKEGGCGVW